MLLARNYVDFDNKGSFISLFAPGSGLAFADFCRERFENVVKTCFMDLLPAWKRVCVCVSFYSRPVSGSFPVKIDRGEDKYWISSCPGNANGKRTPEGNMSIRSVSHLFGNDLIPAKHDFRNKLKLWVKLEIH